jgi:nucleoside-diphosphate-sugar epimerase
MLLITGSRGVIGTALIQKLEKLRVPYTRLLKENWVNFYSSGLEEYIVKNEIDQIVHTAAVVPNIPVIQDSLENSAITSLIDSQIFSLVSKGTYVIYLSGCSLYDNSNSSMKDEKSPIRSSNLGSPYLEAKALGDFNFSNQSNCCNLRISAPIKYGANNNSIVSTYINQLKESGVISVWGAGEREQDFLDVHDIAEAIYLCLEKRVTGTFNISTGIPIKMIQLAQEIQSIWRIGDIQFMHGKPENVNFARFSNGKANKLIGWSPRISLSESLQRIASI